MKTDYKKMLLEKGIYEIDKGKGSLKNYSYWCYNINLKDKNNIANAIILQMKVMRKDKILDRIEEFNYKTNMFEVVKK
jgi:hypothetical protein